MWRKTFLSATKLETLFGNLDQIKLEICIDSISKFSQSMYSTSKLVICKGKKNYVFVLLKSVSWVKRLVESVPLKNRTFRDDRLSVCKTMKICIRHFTEKKMKHFVHKIVGNLIFILMCRKTFLCICLIFFGGQYVFWQKLWQLFYFWLFNILT